MPNSNKINTAIDFSNTEIAFKNKSDKALSKAHLLFRLMNNPLLVKLSSTLGVWAVKWRLPFAKYLVKQTIFSQFCGGTNLEESAPTIKDLHSYSVYSMLDYGAEAKKTEEDFDNTVKENIGAIRFAADNAAVPVISTKITGMARFELLEKVQSKEALTAEETEEFERVRQRIRAVSQAALDHKVGLFIDAEETWIQDSIDQLADEMMSIFNKEEVWVYNTFQMYRKDRYDFLKTSFAEAQNGGYLLGAKLVRGAYMEKERKRAEEHGYPSPIQDSKAQTDKAFNDAIRFCVEHYEQIALCNATHNMDSCQLLASLIEENAIAQNHKHLNFCQLYGMSDHLTFNLAERGYNVAKYLVYGKVREVLPYLVRRAQENTSITGDMSRELDLLNTEMKRRKLN